MRSPRGRISARKFIVLLATLLVVVFGYVFLAPTAYAADASWKDDTIVYQGNTYKKIETPSAVNQMPGYEGITMYEYKTGDNSSQVIYFDAGVDPQNAGEAHYVRFTLNPPNFSDEKTITITPSGTSGSAGSGSPESSCNLDGIGWMICPVSKAIAESMDFLYGVVSDFFRVTPLTTTQGSLYQMWEVFRNAANVLFVIGFLIIIYGQVSGAMLSNYTIKKLLPRLIISAILVNISYWICAVAVDISNILGYAVADLFTNLRDVAGAPNSDAANTPTPTWVNVTAAVLAGGSLTIAGGAALTIAAGTGMGMAFLLLSALLPAIFAILVAVAILAARQALITVFVILAPLAFVAYLLPNTDEWFTRWRKSFTTMLVMFPAFSVIFGGAQLAGTVIIQNAPNIIVVILGMTVQIVPLFITPFLIKLSSGLMATIANITNDRGKGLFDRTKNWADTRRGQEQAIGAAKRAQRAKDFNYLNHSSRRRRNGTIKEKERLRGARKFSPYHRAYYRDYRRQEREGMKTANEAMSEGLFSQTAAASRIHDRTKDAGLEKHLGDTANARRYNTYTQAGLTAQDRYRNSLHHQAHVNEGVSKLAEDRMTAHAERDLQTSINANATLRGLKIGTDVDTAHAKLQAASVEGDAKLAFQTEVDNDRALKVMKVATFVAEQQASSIDNRLTKNAEARWNQLSRTDANLQELRFQEVQATDSAKRVEEQWNSLIENIRAKGGDAPEVALQNEALANSIKSLSRDIEIENQIQGSAKIVQQSDLAEALKQDTGLRKQAAGVDKHGEVRVMAAAKKAVSEELIKMTNNFYDTMDYDIASNPDRLEVAWRDATERGELTEVIAYGRKLALNAPGLRKLKPLLEEFTRGKDPLADDVMLLKEVLGADGSFRDAGRDLEVWANNEINPSTGMPYTDFAEVRHAPAPWANITASRFARMNAYSQEEALYWLQENDTEALTKLLTGIGDETGTIWRELKGSTREKIDIIRGKGPNPNVTRINDPNANR